MTTSKNPSDSVSGFLERWLLGWVPFFAVSLIVFQSAILPPRKIPGFLAQFNDKVIHGTEYFILALVAVHAFRKAKPSFFRSKSFVLALFYGSIMGVVTEVCQLYVPGRSCDFYDWLADLTGTALALVLARVFIKTKETA